MASRRSARSGFTLFEVLVALAIFALAGAALFGLAGQGLDRQGRAERLRGATLLSQSLLDRIGLDLPLTSVASRGEAPPGFRWRVETRPMDPTTVGGATGLRRIDVQVTVAWTEHLREQAITLSTIRVTNVAAR